ncbi:MAG: Hsp20/alpha crystallin family protein [Gammaproteobacteria bacterium]|nr:Hsp20/alpha crystallin family protein [Gammaproteobacteria bacterium]
MSKEEKKEVKKTKEIQTARPARTLSPFEEVDRMLEGFFPRGWMRPFRTEWPSWGELTAPLEMQLPKVDVIDRDAEVVVRAEMPGVDKDNLEVSVSDNAVTIKGETQREEKEEKGNYYRRETSRGAFSRTIALPNYVNTEGCKAAFKDGILELTLPKLEKAKRRTIKID